MVDRNLIALRRIAQALAGALVRGLKFSKLYLLSQSEQRALTVSFPSARVVIKGANGAGKSAVLKSLYDTFGAEPHKIDESWRSASVSSAVEFEYLGASYTVVKTLGTYAMFDCRGEMLFSGQSKVKEWGPELAKFLDFNLEMNDRQAKAVTPPPAYIFAPFYVDQDRGWAAPWSSFKDFYLKNSPKTLAEYHSGLKPDEYYTSLAGQQRAKDELSILEYSRRALQDTLKSVRSISEDANVVYDVDVFLREVDDLVSETRHLQGAQEKYRRVLAEIHDEQHAWAAERHLLASTLAELQGQSHITSEWADEVECPTCGHHYSHSLADRFSLIADEAVLIDAIASADARLKELGARSAAERHRLGEVLEALERVNGILARKKNDISLRDVIVSEGKTEAAKIIGASLDEKEAEARKLFGTIEEQRRVMNETLDPKRIKAINIEFRHKLATYAQELDVRLENPSKQRISAVRVARGSEGPRGLLAYYYAFLQTSAKWGSSVFCPIVLDAPNQQGQDDIRLPRILQFILNEAPSQVQVVIATEHYNLPPAPGVSVQEVGVTRHQVLNENEFGDVNAFFAPFQNAILSRPRPQ